jgi:hypothetical protein
MKAIETKFYGPTNTKGSRITACDCDNNKVTLSYDHSLNSEQNHRAAAVALCNKMQWSRSETLCGGHTKSGMCFVFVPVFGVDPGWCYACDHHKANCICIKQRLEYLRKELRDERISYGELAELQSLSAHIDSTDVELLEAAGIPENEDDK